MVSQYDAARRTTMSRARAADFVGRDHEKEVQGGPQLLVSDRLHYVTFRTRPRWSLRLSPIGAF